MIVRAVLVLAAFASGAPAMAGTRDSPRAVIAAVDSAAQVPPKLTAAARGAIEQGLASSGFKVVATKTLTPELAACRSGACMRDVAKADTADAVIVASLSMTGETPVFDLAMFDGVTAQQVAAVHEACELCGQAEFEERLGVAASALHAQAENNASNAARLAAMRRGAHAGPKRSIVPGLGLGIAGVLAIGAGAYLWSIDGDGTCSPGDEPVFPAAGAEIRYTNGGTSGPYVCLHVYRTRALGIATLGAGVLATAAGVTLVVRARGHAGVVEVAPTPGGASLSLVTRW